MSRTLVALLSSALAIVVVVDVEGQWPRWEERTLDCTDYATSGQCRLHAPNSKIVRDTAKYKCRREPMPQDAWNHLALRGSFRLACPIGCEPNFDLSVLQKKPIDLPHCKKYYSYGKYRSKEEGEWFLWLMEPCASSLKNLTTHCKFTDIPFHS